ncbi:hypothetical protein RUND412_006509 [Rhizina undulata]
MAVISKIEVAGSLELVKLFGFGVGVWLLGVIIYRLYFHPLSKYPGPFLAKITSLHALYHAFRGDRHIVTYEAHKKYGPYVRLSPNFLTVNTKEGLKEIYGVNKNVQKSNFYRAVAGHPSNYTAGTSLTIDKQVHARKRRVLAHAFTDAALRSMEQYVIPTIDTLCNIIAAGEQSIDFEGRAKGKGKWRGDMSKWANYLTFDIMGELSFGKNFGMMERDENRYVPEIINKGGHRGLIASGFSFRLSFNVGTVTQLDTYRLDNWFIKSITEGQKRLYKFARQKAQERVAMKGDRKDFFHYLINAKNPEGENPYSMDELMAESRLLMVAGSDTTATTIAAALFYLTRNTETLAKLATEIRTAFASASEIHIGPTIDSCHYLKAVVEESLRLSPSVPGALPRVVLPGGLQIGTEFFPAGVELGVSYYTLHRNPLYYSSPHEFNPSRWLDEAGEISGDYSAFAPFSIGSRGCIGKRLAYIEIELVLARLVWGFEMKYISGGADGRVKEGDEYMLIDNMTAARHGPIVEFSKREGVEIM